MTRRHHVLHRVYPKYHMANRLTCVFLLLRVQKAGNRLGREAWSTQWKYFLNTFSNNCVLLRHRVWGLARHRMALYAYSRGSEATKSRNNHLARPTLFIYSTMLLITLAHATKFRERKSRSKPSTLGFRYGCSINRTFAAFPFLIMFNLFLVSSRGLEYILWWNGRKRDEKENL